jgi:nicotinamide riboside transporter PnuC
MEEKWYEGLREQSKTYRNRDALTWLYVIIPSLTTTTPFGWPYQAIMEGGSLLSILE